jgi:hypothetical protein
MAHPAARPARAVSQAGGAGGGVKCNN